MAQVYVGRIRSVVGHGVLTVVTAGLYFLVWQFLVNHDVRRHRGRGPHPFLLFLLFLLVPVLGWFIAVFLSAGAVRKAQVAADADGRSSRFIPALWSLLPILGWAIAGALVQAGANRAWDRLHRDLDRVTSGPVTLECPQCSHRLESFLNPFAPNAIVCPSCGRAGEV